MKDSYKSELQKIQTQIDMAEQTIGGQVRIANNKKKRLINYIAASRNSKIKSHH